MENKINIAELLKDCPRGMELDCTTWENVTFEEVRNDTIIIVRNNKQPYVDKVALNKYGRITSYEDEKCRIFPKGKTTWEGFVPPYQFKDGDVLAGYECLVLFKKLDGLNIKCYCTYCFMNNPSFHVDTLQNKDAFHLSTEEEKAKLLKAIKDNGYCWNPETKTLEKLVEPKFKGGDRIRNKNTGEIFKIDDINMNIGVYCCGSDYIQISYQDKYELVPDKFDISKLQPFDKVLVRDFDNETWEINFFSKLLDGKHFKCLDLSYVQCIPYEGNEHLLNTTDDCDDFYKN